MYIQESDTIAALATPVGEGGISVIRITGPQALLVADKAYRGRSPLSQAASHTAHVGRFQAPDATVLDEVVALVFRAPNSYTGEDTVELSCHGGILVTKRIVESLIDYGARHAGPGEFTKRAFLNGKLDLAQAEAVADLIQARSELAHRSSFLQLEGALSSRVRGARGRLIDALSLIELELDFAEDGFEFIDKTKVGSLITDLIGEMSNLIVTYRAGRIYREGVKVVIAGPPNAGKSSLLNALLGENRAIVTAIPGTTRDTIEEALNIGGVMFKLVDTAGMRRADDPVEQEGVRRTEDQIMSCDVLLLVVDASCLPSETERSSMESAVREKAPASAAKLVALNKIDLIGDPGHGRANGIDIGLEGPFARVSAVTRQGIEELKRLLLESVFSGRAVLGENTVTVTNARHYDALLRCQGSLRLALQTLEEGQSGEFIAIDLRRALESLGEITGEVTTEEILNGIFSKFCIGK